MNRGSRASEVINLVNFNAQWLCHIMTQQLKIRVIHQVANIALSAREKVIDAKNFVTIAKKALTKMGTKKPGTSSYQNTHFTSPFSKF